MFLESLPDVQSIKWSHGRYFVLAWVSLLKGSCRLSTQEESFVLWSPVPLGMSIIWYTVARGSHCKCGNGERKKCPMELQGQENLKTVVEEQFVVFFTCQRIILQLCHMSSLILDIAFWRESLIENWNKKGFLWVYEARTLWLRVFMSRM